MNAENLISKISCGIQDALKTNKAIDIADTISKHYHVNVSTPYLYNLARATERGSRFDTSVRRAFAILEFVQDWRHTDKMPWLNK